MTEGADGETDALTDEVKSLLLYASAVANKSNDSESGSETATIVPDPTDVMQECLQSTLAKSICIYDHLPDLGCLIVLIIETNSVY